MNLDRDTQVKEIFGNALEQAPTAERAAYLDEACGRDAQLRRKVEALLRAHEEAGGFLEEPTAALPGLTVNLSTPLTEKPGDCIGRYKLREQIGEGGCGVVYVADQKEPVRRRVALKVIKLGMDTKSVIARFEAERQALARMDHPNIAKVLDAGSTETGRPFFVMELVRGIQITDYCDQNKLSTHERLDLFIQVCHAVQHAHQKGVIHRDIKPSNILVTLHDAVPVPKIIDFGIAKATEGRLTDHTVYTELRQFIGTPAYMSPEQAEMSGLDIDTRSDIYSLGVLLYELLTGQPPFDPKQLLERGLDEIRRTIREIEPPRPSTRLSTLANATLRDLATRRHTEAPKLLSLIRGDLDWIVMKCLEKDRTRRYETANGLAHDILRHLNNEAVLARPPSRLYRFQKLVRRNKLVLGAAGTVVAALVLGVMASTWQAVRATRAKREALEARAKAVEAQASETKLREQAQAQELTARQHAYASDMNLVRQALDGNNLGRALDLLNRQRPGPGQEDLRGWEWRYLWQQTRSDASFTLCRESSEVASLAAAPDGNLLAIGMLDKGGLSVWDLRTRRELTRLVKGEVNLRAVFSPADPLLAFAGSTTFSAQAQTTLRLWNSVTRQTIGEFPLDAPCAGLAFSADGRTLVTYTYNGRITLWRMPEGTRVATYFSEQWFDESGTIFAATSDLSHAAHALAGGRIRLVDLRDGRELWTAIASKEFVTALAFSPDGKTLASGPGYTESDIRLWDVASGKEIGKLAGHGSWIASMVFWPDGKKLASSSGDQTIRIWDVASQKCVDLLRGHRLEVWRLALLPGGKTLASGGKDGTVCIWDTAVSHPRQALSTIPDDVVYWGFTPDDRSVLALNQRGQLSRWSGSAFQQKEPLLEIGTNLYASHVNLYLSPFYYCFSQDRKVLAVGSTNGVLQVWDISRGVLARQWTNTTGLVGPGCFLAGGDRLITASMSDNLFHEWDLTTGLEMQCWQGPVFPCDMLVLSPDERSFLAGNQEGDVALRNLIARRNTKLDLDVLEADSGSYSPDGKLFVVASALGYARVWDTTTWREVATLRGFLLGLHSVAFAADGRRLATGSDDTEALKLWDTESWQELLTLKGQGSAFWFTEFSPDGNAIGTMNMAGTVHLWRAPSWDEIRAAEASEKAASAANP